MSIIFGRAVSLFTALFISLGFLSGSPAEKYRVAIEEISLKGADVTGGCEITVPFLSGLAGFNRISFSYNCTHPVRAVFTCRQGAKIIKEELLLSSEENNAAMLIGGYLAGKTATRLLSVRFEPVIPGQGTTLSVSDFICALQTVPEDKKYYIENERYKVGINLSWGGGICYFEDKKCPVEGMKNLINQHDTGRLVQQSYYGTAGNEEYQPGTSFDMPWVYNPVQGGDQYGNASRLIDFKAYENSVYIKTQPQDWSLNNALTPSYMENTYTVCDGFLKVDNRFIDFSGWEHRYASQELPAFYTVSYLSRFTWYDGVHSWQDDVLTHRDDLKFWGTYSSECTFRFKNGNTETWCAWVSPESNYGIGLFVPGVDVLKAGRYEFNNSKDAESDATNYVAPLKVIRITSFSPIEYSYIMTTGSTEQIRETFRQNRNFTSNPGLEENSLSERAD